MSGGYFPCLMLSFAFHNTPHQHAKRFTRFLLEKIFFLALWLSLPHLPPLLLRS